MHSRLLIGSAAIALVAAGASFAQTPPASPPPNPPPATVAPAPAPLPATTPGPSRQDQATMAPERAGPTENQLADEIDARIAQLKASLRLSPEQDGKWGDVRDALREYGLGVVRGRLALDEETGRGLNRERRGDMTRSDMADAPDARPNDLALMRLEADDMARRADGLRKIATAAEPFFGEMNPRQQRMLIRFIDDGFDRIGRTRRNW
ncbi:hypothetical protein [Terrarubrum flagellatum]|uniref:hypothetical protein n=1 Tax=Terrirubrum flagellatum TaxID=2895980 RepID=UPI0031453FEA